MTVPNAGCQMPNAKCQVGSFLTNGLPLCSNPFVPSDNPEQGKLAAIMFADMGLADVP